MREREIAGALCDHRGNVREPVVLQPSPTEKPGSLEGLTPNRETPLRTLEFGIEVLFSVCWGLIAYGTICMTSNAFHLKPANKLRLLPQAQLRRNGSFLLRRTLKNNRGPVAVAFEGIGTMVLMSRAQYDAIVELVEAFKNT